MKQFIIFVKKEFHHIFRDRKSLLIIFALPIAQILIFGFALTNEIKNSEIVVWDQSKDEESQKLIDRFSASTYFEIAYHVSSMEEVNRLLKGDKVKMALIIPQQFKNDLLHSNSVQLQLLADATDPNTATTIIFYSNAIIRDYQNTLNEDFEMPYTITPELRMLYNPQLIGAYIYVPGVMGMILLLISAMMTSIAIVREKELNTMEIILASPLKPLSLIISKAIPYILISLINVSTILILSVTLLEVPINGNIFLLFGVCFLFITTAISLGLMISNLTDSQQTAMFISMIALMLPTLILSGFMFPIENMPKPLQYMSHLVPTKWFFTIIKDVMIKGLGIGSIWKELSILAGMTILFLLVSLKNFKSRLG